MVSGGIRHGDTFEDLVTGRAVHGRLTVSITFGQQSKESVLDVTIGNTVEPRRASERLVLEWRLQHDERVVFAQRQGYEMSADYQVSATGSDPTSKRLDWRGLLPRNPDALAPWVGAGIHDSRRWATGVRHLQCPRSLPSPPFLAPEAASVSIGSDGRGAPLALAADDNLRLAVRDWYSSTFGVGIDVAAQGRYAELMTDTPIEGGSARMLQSGRGLSHVLPVAVTALSAHRAGVGVDVIEHPEAELHPAAHGHVAELLLDNLAGLVRPMIVETHSAMLLLRARRWIAEGRLQAGDVLVYWIHAESG